MLAVQGNKQIKIEEKDKAYYLTLGYDIADVDEKGNLTITENAPGKTVTYAKYKEALDKIVELENQIEALKNPKGK
ncbi:hypothetical protein [Clostridium pasteurianum]|uniref:Uncharacterized protein n=1 Tax=Clostridium pasteurianum BC1 TaxID=86416 RepID=R4K1I5_CLOPA|nr:hypothetical protein [Clostridium pasteurianum]AGK95626.1 hypothetical protein Clopa_0578 [Clostridium pasteurianum BC1]